MLAAGDGTVAFAGMVAGRPVLSIQHGQVRTTYEPVAATVTIGEHVSRGQPVGRLLASGSHCGPSACLHWGALRGNMYFDPMSLLGNRAVRLLPLG